MLAVVSSALTLTSRRNSETLNMILQRIQGVACEGGIAIEVTGLDITDQEHKEVVYDLEKLGYTVTSHTRKDVKIMYVSWGHLLSRSET